MLGRVKRGYRELQWVAGVTGGYKGLERVKKRLQRVTRGYKWLQKVTRG